jgi:hypothetical protein
MLRCDRIPVMLTWISPTRPAFGSTWKNQYSQKRIGHAHPAQFISARASINSWSKVLRRIKRSARVFDIHDHEYDNYSDQ